MRKLLSILVLLIFVSVSAQKSKIDLEDDDNFDGFELFKDSLENYTVFINGENHSYTKSNAALQLKMLKYLHQNAGVKTLLLELGWSRGYIITKYIQEGDTTLLPSIKGYSWKYYADLVESLRKYNDSLPASDKISVVGIDVERFNNMAVKALEMQLPKNSLKKPHDSIEVSIESIFALNTYLETSSEWDEEKGEYVYHSSRGPSVNKSLKYILDNIKDHKEKYLDYISPENHVVFLKVVEQLNDKFQYEEYDYANTVQSYVYRERYMYNQFLELFEKDTTQKYFMQFGRCHSVKTYQKEACTWHHYYSIANRINESENPKLKGKVLSTAIYYPSTDAWGNFEDSLKKHIEEVYLDSSYKDSLTLWNVRLDTNFTDKHEFIIINQKLLKSDKDPKAVSSWDNYNFEESDLKFLLNFKFGMAFTSFSSLNKYTATRGYAAYDRKGVWGMDLGFLKNGGIYLGGSFISPYAKKIISTISDTLRINPSYWYADLGYDLVNKKPFDLIPYLGIGMENIKLKEIQSITTGIVGSSVNSVATSTTFNSRIGLKTQFNINDFILGLDYSYYTNLGKTSWANKVNVLGENPLMKTKGQTLTAYFGFFL